MCGIAGFSLSPQSTLPVRQFAHALLLHSEERGKVASGWAFQNAGRTTFHKRPVQGGHLSLKAFERGARTGMIHTRNATFGKPEDNDNNHPLMDPNRRIVLVHNGVIQNHEAIRTGMPEEVFSDVDSSVLPSLIRVYGVDGLSEVTGWAAVSWFDTLTPDVLHLARVKGAAPVVVIGLSDGSIVFGSTFQIVHAALIECGMGDQITWGYELEEYTYLQLKAGQIVHMQNLKNLKVHEQRFKGKTMTWQEEQRLKAITNGTDKGGTPPASPSSLATPPVGGGTAVKPVVTNQRQVSQSAFTPDTSVAPSEDPLARINAALAAAPKPLPVVPMHVGGSTFRSIPLDPPIFSDITESWITYWFQFEGEEKESLTESAFDDRSCYEEFRDWVTDSARDNPGQMIDWGIVGVDDKLVSTKHCKTTEEEQDLILAVVQALADAERPVSPADRTPMWSEDDYEDYFGRGHVTAQSEFEEVNRYLSQGYSELN